MLVRKSYKFQSDQDEWTEFLTVMDGEYHRGSE